MRSIVPRAALAVALLLPTTPLRAQQRAVSANEPPLVVTTAWLAENLRDPNLVVVEVAMDSNRTGRIPGTRVISYGRFATRSGTLGTELPDGAALREAFAELGITDESHVVVYAHQAPMATRALYSLAWLGQARISFLDGGLEKWTTESRPVATVTAPSARGRISERAPASVIVDAAWMQANVGKPGVSFIDTRTDGEYNGTGNRSGMPSVGHVEGARQLEWEDLFADRSRTLKPRAELERLFAERVKPGDTVATYCWVGYRASATWFVARWLGYDARLYDGSYQDWSQRNLPTRAGTAP